MIKLDLNVILTSVLTDLETTITTTGQKITCNTLPIIEANETQMYQVIQNLLSMPLNSPNQTKPRKLTFLPQLRIIKRRI